MKLYFFKYEGTGNDFILIDNRKKIIPEFNHSFFKKLCHRRFGVGADGIILIKNDTKSYNNFYMKYYNSDGKESTMCGNGGRCAIAFSNKLGITKKKDKVFYGTIDGNHCGMILNKKLISTNLINVNRDKIKICSKYVFLNTGSPHHVIFVENLKKIDVFRKGREISKNLYSDRGGVNVNFVEILGKNIINVRTYERGVENETLSCGTGVTASVIAIYETEKFFYHENGKTLVNTLGGELWVSLKKIKNQYKDIYLTGRVQFIFEGFIHI
ncbi:diaminopimelate epimerase [Blattabacterium cuenoti]|uniref:diaminopimelate epimerase n=1 Tax=Blattabacterium cuenoti TaxID=1653831 RepID=UPI00163C61AF|nr:diaminopimelate epimerase [Blattabacterium cuenoti]